VVPTPAPRGLPRGGLRPLFAALLLAACGSKPSAEPVPCLPVAAVIRDAGVPDARPGGERTDLHGGRQEDAPHEHERELGPDGLAVVSCPVRKLDDLDAILDQAGTQYDAGAFAVSLACADRGLRLDAHSIEAFHDRGLALAALERWDEARMAFAMALALDPADPETLAGAADLYVNQAPQSREGTDLGLEYARRGAAIVAGKPRQAALGARLLSIEAQALDDLGRSDEALRKIDAALGLAPRDPSIAGLRALVLFHLCRFAEADKAYAALPPAPGGEDAYEVWNRGLIAERLGRQAEADQLLARAHALLPAELPDPALVPTPAAWKKLVDDAVADLPPPLKAALARSKLETPDLPSDEDLLSVQPPFASTILGLFRGPPIGEAALPGDPPRAIVLYRKNIARAVMTHAELVEQVRVTLWHELGHLRGDDDDDLREKGLE
jgi:predicted Zn-dependent protease with MMP-like domain/Flp pilus assembly protein TadD